MSIVINIQLLLTFVIELMGLKKSANNRTTLNLRDTNKVTRGV